MSATLSASAGAIFAMIIVWCTGSPSVAAARSGARDDDVREAAGAGTSAAGPVQDHTRRRGGAPRPARPEEQGGRPDVEGSPSGRRRVVHPGGVRSEEHTSELQSRQY